MKHLVLLGLILLFLLSVMVIAAYHSDGEIDGPAAMMMSTEGRYEIPLINFI